MDTSKKSQIREVSNKSKTGLFLYTFRSIIINVLQLISSLILAKYLSSNDYGIFGIINGYIGVMRFFTDIGLSIAIVQHPEKVSERLIQTYYTIRVLLSTILVFVFFFIAENIVSHFGMSSSNIIFIKLLGVLNLVETLGCVPQLKLNMDLAYDKLAKADLHAALSLYFVQIVGAILGFGFWSFFLGIAAKAIVYLISVSRYIFPFKKFLIDLESIRGMVKIGIFHQLNMALNGVSTILLPLVLKLSMDVKQIGIIFWMEGLVSIPKMIAYNWNNVFYPSISHLLHDDSQARDFINVNIGKLLIVMSFIFGLGGTLGHHFVELLFDHKWQSARPYIFLAAIHILGKMNIFVFTAVLASLRKPEHKFKIEILNMALDLFLIWSFMRSDFILEYYMATLTSSAVALIISFYFLRGWITKNTYLRLFSTTLAAALPYFIELNLYPELNIFITFFSFITLYLLILLLIDYKSFQDIKTIVNLVRSKIFKSKNV